MSHHCHMWWGGSLYLQLKRTIHQTGTIPSMERWFKGLWLRLQVLSVLLYFYKRTDLLLQHTWLIRLQFGQSRLPYLQILPLGHTAKLVRGITMAGRYTWRCMITSLDQIILITWHLWLRIFFKTKYTMGNKRTINLKDAIWYNRSSIYIFKLGIVSLQMYRWALKGLLPNCRNQVFRTELRQVYNIGICTLSSGLWCKCYSV